MGESGNERGMGATGSASAFFLDNPFLSLESEELGRNLALPEFLVLLGKGERHLARGTLATCMMSSNYSLLRLTRTSFMMRPETFQSWT